MVITRSGRKTVPVRDKKINKRENSAESSSSRPSSFEADFASLCDSDSDDNVFSSDSGILANAEQIKKLNMGRLESSFQLNRRHREDSSFESTRELFTPPPPDCNSSMLPRPDLRKMPLLKEAFSPIAPITPRAVRSRVFDTPGTPRSLVRRLSQNSSNSSSPRWQRKGAKRQRASEQGKPCIVNPFSPPGGEGASKNRTITQQLNASTCRSLIHQNATTRLKRDFIELGPLGVGSFGDVIRVRNRFDGIVYAIKKSRNPLTGSRQEIKAIREVCAHAVLGEHENVVRYYSAWSEDDRMMIQFEYCNGKSLQAELVDRVQRGLNGMNESELSLLLNNCARGLAYIHAQDLAHMDIKPGNIFRSIRSDQSIVYKIGDLGHVCPVDERTYDEGDCRYASREIIENMQLEKRESHSSLCKADIFSLGLTTFEAATLMSLPNNGATWHSLRSSSTGLIESELGKTKTRLSDKMKSMIVAMTSEDPNKRPKASDLHQGLNKRDIATQNKDESAKLVDKLYKEIRFLQEQRKQELLQSSQKHLTTRMSTA